jgi:hypothetical protein
MKEVKQSKAVRFTNWTNQDFSHKWDSVEYTFKAGEQTYLQDYLAFHFAKHLAQRECNKKNILMSDLRFKEYYEKCLSEDVISADTSLKLEMEMAKEEKPDDKKEAMRARMAKARASKKSKVEDDFAGK